MAKNSIADSRRLTNAVDRLDAVSAVDRQSAAKYVFDVCVYHVARVRKTHPVPQQHQQQPQQQPQPQQQLKSRGHGRSLQLSSKNKHSNSNNDLGISESSGSTTGSVITPQFVFDVIHPHIYRIARRLDRAMRYAESSPHPSDAAALISAVDAQGALAALFAVAQNAGCNSIELDTLAMPLRKRSAPALLRTLFSPDMRVANAAKKALRQIITIASCQSSPWMSTIRSALSLRTATKINRSVQLKNLLTRLAEILQLVIKQAAISSKVTAAHQQLQQSANNYTNNSVSINDSVSNQQQQYYHNLTYNNGYLIHSSNSNATLKKKSSRTSLSNMVIGSRSRPSLSSERRAAERYAEVQSTSSSEHRLGIRDFFRRRASKQLARSSSRASVGTSGNEKSTKRRFNNMHSYHSQQNENQQQSHRQQRPDISTFSPYRSATTPNIETSINAEDWHSVASGGVLSTGGGSYPGSAFSSVTESGTGTILTPSNQLNSKSRTNDNSINQQQQHHNNIKRDAATAMYIFERLLAKRTNPDLEDRIQVLKILTDIVNSTFSGKYATLNKIINAEEYAEAMAIVFNRHGLKIYSVILDILFRPVKEADANRIGIFSFHEAGIVAAGGATNALGAAQDINNAIHHSEMHHMNNRHTHNDGIDNSPGNLMVATNKRKVLMADFPQSAICLPSMECTDEAATTANTLMKFVIKYLPGMCTQRMALITGTINSAFLYCSEALITNNNNNINNNIKIGNHRPRNNNSNNNMNGKCKWDLEKLKRATNSLDVLVKAIPSSVEMALELIIREPVTLRLVIETCIRSVSATGRLIAQNAARYSAPRISDEGTLDSLRSWQKLIKILPGSSAWSGTPSYSSSILFLAQVARRAALIEAVKELKKNKKKYSTAGTFVGNTNEGNGTDKTIGKSTDNRDENSNEESFGMFKGELETDDQIEVTTTEEIEEGNTAKNDESISRNINRRSSSSRVTESDGNESKDEGIDSENNGMERDEENVLIKELHQSIIDMINIPGTSPGDIFFELYRTIIYLYANDLKKQAKASNNLSNNGTNEEQKQSMTRSRKITQAVENDNVTEKIGTSASNNDSGNIIRGAGSLQGNRSQSDEDAKGVLVENIAVDGQLPSRALRRAVMASELDLGEYFSEGNNGIDNNGLHSNTNENQQQPPSLQHLSQHEEYKGLVPIGVHTFEEFSQALAIIIGTLSNRVITENFENPQEAASMIARDVQRSGSSYLKKVHRRAKTIMKKDLAGQEIDWRSVQYEERIKKLEEQVASLKSLVQSSLENGPGVNLNDSHFVKRASLTKILGLCGGAEKERENIGRDSDEDHSVICGPSGCFC